MAITVVQSGQSAGGANSNSSTISGATAGNTVVAFCSQSGSTSAPTVTLGGVAMTVNGTSGVYNSSADSMWVAYKIATGGETSIAWTPGSGGTVRGNNYYELAGAASSVTLDGTAQHTDNLNAATGGVAVTTATAGSIVLIGVGQNASSGTISAWTGTNVATNISTSASRCFGGSFITTSTVSSTFTANWATSHVAAMLAIALKPPGGSTTSKGIDTSAGQTLALTKTALKPIAPTSGATLGLTRLVVQTARSCVAGGTLALIKTVVQTARSCASGCVLVVTKAVGKPLSASSGGTLVLATLKSFGQVVSASAGASLSVVRVTLKPLAPVAGATLTVTRLVAKPLTFTTGATLGLTKAVAHPISASCGAALGLTKRVGKSIAATIGAALGLTGTFVEAPERALTPASEATLTLTPASEGSELITPAD